ncbi:hypothetical protein [uncultured Clostridium sp.]|uniref:hypothetical protein n=1 Tax=uncultured Clostridium sp. TaxID=59620 RepID=UPI0032164CDB
MDKIVIDSDYKIEISESQELDCLNVKMIICDFLRNKNGFKINRENIGNWLKTLLFKPVVGKIEINKEGEEDFTSHQAKKVYKFEGNNIKQSLKFGTEAFGTFCDVGIEEIEGVEYIVATAKIWKRFEKCCEIIQARYDNNETLSTSWEISILEQSEIIADGKKTKDILNGVFIGHALLSKFTSPAYDSAVMLEVAELEKEDSFQNALLEDLQNINNLEISSQSDVESVENILKKNEGGITKMSEENKVKDIETSSLTNSDLRSKVTRAIYATEGNGRYYYGVIILPLEFRAIAKLEGQDTKEFDYTEFTYAVNSDETISITSQQDVEMVFVPKVDNDNVVSELENKLKEVNTSLSEKVEEIIKLGETIKTQETNISEKDSLIEELTPFKEQISEINAEKEKLEIAEKQNTLKIMALSSKYITEEEIETCEELKKAIGELDEKAVKEMIAERVIAQATQNKPQEEKVEVSERTDEVEVSTDLNTTQEYNYSKSGNILLDFINKKSRK